MAFFSAERSVIAGNWLHFRSNYLLSPFGFGPLTSDFGRYFNKVMTRVWRLSEAVMAKPALLTSSRTSSVQR